MLPELSPRQAEYLIAVIEHHVRLAAPVGSRTLALERGRGLSSASIRATMASLERIGVIGRPHASAGRVPTDLGYRVYVERLMARREPSPAERARLARQLEVEPCDAQRLADALAAELRHLTLVVEHSGGRRRAVYGGLEHVVSEPEFREGARLARLCRLLDDRTALGDRIAALAVHGRAGVALGSEIARRPEGAFGRGAAPWSDAGALDGCALVSIGLRGPGPDALAVLGPARMDYGAIVARLDALGELWDARQGTRIG